jgi:hypothetical protein
MSRRKPHLRYVLSEDGRYSKAEKLLFAHLPKNGRKVTTSNLASAIHGRQRHGRVRIVGTLSGLMFKTRLNREPFRIKRDTRQGPHPIGIWLERK